MKKRATYFILIFLLVSSAAAHAATVDVSMQNMAFLPQTVAINVGDTVRWTNNDTALSGVFHTTTSGTGCNADGMWNSGFMVPGQTFEKTFNVPGTFPYFDSIHCAQFNMVGTVVVNAATGTMAVPSTAQVFTFRAVENAVVTSDPATALPIGVGTVATGGRTLSLNIQLPQFSGPVDVFFLMFLPAIDETDIFEVTEDHLIRKLSDGFFPFMANTMGPLNEDIFGDIPTFFLPNGEYFFAVLVTPQGNTSISAFYLWITNVTIS